MAARRRRRVNTSFTNFKGDRAAEQGMGACEALGLEGEEEVDLRLTESNAALLVLAMTRELLRPTPSKAQATAAQEGGGKGNGQYAVAA